MANYPIPPWLAPHTDWGALQVAHNRTQMEINQHAAQLNQQAEQFNQQMEMRKVALEAETKAKADQLQQQALLAQHRMEIDAAYKQAETGLQQQRLEQVKRQVDFHYNEAADKEAKRQKFEQTYAAKVQAGTDPHSAFQESLYEQGASAGMPAAAYSMAGKGTADEFAPSETDVNGVKMLKVSPNHYVLKPNQTATGGPVGKEMIAPGKMRVTYPNGRESVITIPPFKFSGDREIKQIETDFGPYLQPGVEPPSSSYKDKIEAARTRYQQLQQQRQQEQQQYDQLMQNSQPQAPAKPRYTWDQGSSSLLTNSPASATE